MSTNNQEGALQNYQNEWCYEIKVDDIPTDKGLFLTIEPSKEQKTALCKRLNLMAINSLVCELRLKRNAGNMVIHVEGHIKANVQQYCIVTLDSVPEAIDDYYESWYCDHNQAVSFSKAKRERMSIKERGEQPMMEESEDPEAIIDGKLDLGELTTQHLSLMLNPYPRKEGVEYNAPKNKASPHETEDLYANPFAALKDWKAKEGKKEG